MSLHVTIFHSFQWLSNIPLCVHHIFFVHEAVIGHLGCLYVLAIVNSAVVNTGVHVPFQIMVFSGHMPSICADVLQRPPQHCKAIILQLKKKRQRERKYIHFEGKRTKTPASFLTFLLLTGSLQKKKAYWPRNT